MNTGAVRLARRLKLWQKLGIIGLAFTVPLALTTYFLVRQQSTHITFGQKELDGLTYLRPVDSLEVSLVRHARAQRRVLAGDSSATAQQQASASAVEAALVALVQVDARLGSELKTSAAELERANLPRSLPATIRADWQAALGATTVTESDQTHQTVIEDTKGLITHVGNTSNLILDPDLDTYYVMDALLLQEPLIIDLLGRIGQTVDGLAPSQVTSEERSALAVDAAILGEHMDLLTADLQTAFRETNNFNHSTTLEPVLAPLLQAATGATGSLDALLAQLDAQPTAAVSTSDLDAAVDAAFNAHADLWAPLLDQEADMLDARKSGQLRNRWTSLAMVLVAVIATAVVMVIVARRLVKDVNKLAKAARDIAAGDLTVRAPVSRGDEIGHLADDFNEMATRLEELSTQVRDGALGISRAATGILTSVSQQTAGAAQQSASIAEISVATEEVRRTAEVMLTSAEKMAQQARDSLDVSVDGNTAVEAIRKGMESIRDNVHGIAADILALAEQTQQIGEITALVSELADQSNLLALNANIEAAKAGEQGKGFAVVAAQVRLLAEQSKQATSQVGAILTEIRTAANAAVIATEAGSKVVEDGMELATRADDVIRHLGETISETAESSLQITDGLQDQKVAIEQISQAIGEVRLTTTQYVAGTEVSQRTAQDLSELAEPLRELTERYKLTAASDGRATVPV